MFNCPSARHSPHLVSPIEITQLQWIFFGLCVLLSMVKPAHAAVEQVAPLFGGNQYIYYAYQPSVYPQLVKSDPLSACQAITASYPVNQQWASLSVVVVRVYTPAYPYLYQYNCSGLQPPYPPGRPFSNVWINPVIPPVAAVCPFAMPALTFNPNTNFCERPIQVCPAGQKPHPQTGCMLDCPVGTFANVNDTACVADTAPSCDIKPMLPLPIEATDQCTAALENTSYTQDQKDAVCGTLTTAMQTEVACFTEKLKQKNITIDVGNKVRSTAYQAHFRDIWEKMKDLIERTEIYPAQEAACAPRRAELQPKKAVIA